MCAESQNSENIQHGKESMGSAKVIAERVLEAVRDSIQPFADQVMLSNGRLELLLSDVSGETDWKILGEVIVLPQSMHEDVSGYFMDIFLMLTSQPVEGMREEIITGLAELNQLALFGTVTLNENGQLCYGARFPVNGDDPEHEAERFSFVMCEMRSFLDVFYPYLLRLGVKPQQSSLQSYLEQIL